ncbi:uncharacterized protein LOC144908812 isoform X2 [Branchiostoma floridae x Branchiostoma belcheri]
MSSKKSSPNDKAAPEGSVGRHGNRWTNGIALALSGLAAVVSVVALIKVQGIASMQDQQSAFTREARDQQTAFTRETRDQQTAFMRETRDQQTAFQIDLQGLGDQVLLMQLKQKKREAKDKSPASSTEDWHRDDSATFWKSEEVHHRPKRNSEANTVLILGKRSVKGFTVWARSFASKDPGYPNTTDKYDRSYISINGQASKFHKGISRGHQVYILNEQNGTVLDKAVFDTYAAGGGRAAAGRLTTYLQKVEEGRIIVIAVVDTGASYVDLAPYGSTIQIGFRESFAMITQKGRTPSWFVEKKSAKGAGPTVVQTFIPAVKSFTVWARSFAHEDPGFANLDPYSRTYISINGQASKLENGPLRGHQVYILNEQNGTVLDTAVFDTWYYGGGRAAAQRLTTYLQEVEEGRIIVIAVFDTVGSRAPGSTIQIGHRESFAMITQKGRTPPWFVEKKSARGAGPTVVEAYIQVL